MTALDLLARLRKRGLDLRLDGGTLYVSPAGKLTDGQRDLLRLHKPALLLILAGKGPQVGQRLYWQPDPEREKRTDPKTGKRVGVRPRWYTWEGAPTWYRVAPPEEGEG